MMPRVHLNLEIAHGTRPKTSFFKRARDYAGIHIITLLIRLGITSVTVISAVIQIIISVIYAVTVISFC